VPRNPRANPLALAVLCTLYEQPMHPYEVSQTLRSRAKHESIKLNFGSLYSVVEGLEGRGLIRARETVREGRRPERTVYEITEAGTREMNEWLSELVATPVKEFPQFEAALSLLGGLPPDEAAVQLQRRADALEMRLTQQRAVLEAAHRVGLPRLFSPEGEYEVAVLEAELAWVRDLVVDIESGQLDGLVEWRSWYEPGAEHPAITRVSELRDWREAQRASAQPRELPASGTT
jgi:DNA-binding PadR family transcriptional regulator